MNWTVSAPVWGFAVLIIIALLIVTGGIALGLVLGRDQGHGEGLEECEEEHMTREQFERLLDDVDRRAGVITMDMIEEARDLVIQEQGRGMDPEEYTVQLGEILQAETDLMIRQAENKLGRLPQ